MLALAVCGLAAAMVAIRMAGGLPPAQWLGAALHPADADVAQLVFHFATLPRIVVAALCGAGLAASGAIFQHVLGNPLASPVTLGVSSGAQLALVAATLAAPTTLGAVPDLVGLLGGIASTAIVFAVASRQRFSILGLILSGLCVGLFCGALGSLLKLFDQEYLAAVFLWGAGSLAQVDWSVVQRLVPRLTILGVAAVLLLRPLRVLGLSGEGARGLGVSLTLYRTLTLGVAVGLAATITAAVGMIGFIEIASPLVARLAGARTLGHRLILSAAIGAALLVIVDTVVQGIDDRTGAFLPTGAATALLGAPLLLWLLPRLRADATASVGAFDGPRHRTAHPVSVLPALVVAAFAALIASLVIGHDGAGWSVLGPSTWAAILPWRGWRVAEAFAGGAMAAGAGTLLQRLTGNPMASPEILGLGAAVMAGITLAIVIDPTASLALLLATGSCAALVLVGVVLWRGLRSRFAPDQLLLTGVALSAALDAVVVMFLAMNDGRAALLLHWMSGSTAAADAASTLIVLGLAAGSIPLAMLFGRSLDILALGDPLSRALGIALAPTRLGVMVLSAIMTTGAVLTIGPLTFVGLIGPHLARRLGLHRGVTQLPGAALVGGLVMVLADWIGRVAIAPFELPSGLTAALIGVPYLLLQLSRRPAR